MDPGWGSWECSSWRKEGCVETSQHPAGSEGATGNCREGLHQELESQDKRECFKTEREEV